MVQSFPSSERSTHGAGGPYKRENIDGNDRNEGVSESLWLRDHYEGKLRGLRGI